jgi:abhydrolase domain-containing protein 6
MGGIELAIGKAQYRAFTGVLRLLAGVRQGSAVIEGVHVPYLIRRRPASSGATARVPIVLVHGFGADKEGWLLMASKLDRRHSLVIPDLPGFGAAGAIPKHAASAAAQARVLAALLDALEYPRVHLVGSSMGGGISLRFAEDFPERAASMTLIGSAGPIVEKSELGLALDRGENPLLTSGPDDFQRLLHFVAERVPPMSRAARAYLGAERYARRDAMALVWDGWLTPATTEGIPESLESIKTPALVIHGDRDRVIHPATGEALAARLPNARLDLLEGVGHLPMMEKPKEIAALVDRFVASVA